MSSLSDFLGEIGRHELLTPEQELTMGREVQAMVALNERCKQAGGNGPKCEYSNAEKKALNLIKKLLTFDIELYKVNIAPYSDVGEM